MMEKKVSNNSYMVMTPFFLDAIRGINVENKNEKLHTHIIICLRIWNI